MSIPAAVVQTTMRTASGGSISTGIWTLVGVVVTTIGVVAVAYIRQRGPWKKNESDARDSDFTRLREEIASLNQRIDKLDGQVASANRAAEEAGRHAVRSDAKLQTALTACEVLLGLVEREMPEAHEISLVKRLLAQAAADDLGVGAGMRKIAQMQGTGE